MSPNDGWICAPVVENSLIVNVGDFLMRLTNDLYKSTIHRVVNRSDKERHSVPFFFSFNHDLVVEVSTLLPLPFQVCLADEYIVDTSKLCVGEQPCQVSTHQCWRIHHAKTGVDQEE